MDLTPPLSQESKEILYEKLKIFIGENSNEDKNRANFAKNSSNFGGPGQIGPGPESYLNGKCALPSLRHQQPTGNLAYHELKCEAFEIVFQHLLQNDFPLPFSMVLAGNFLELNWSTILANLNLEKIGPPEEMAKNFDRQLCENFLMGHYLIKNQPLVDSARFSQEILTLLINSYLKFLTKNWPEFSAIFEISQKFQPIFPNSYYAIKNNRRKMEDRHVLVPNLNLIYPEKLIKNASFFAVFDGHGGRESSNYAATHLLDDIMTSLACFSNAEKSKFDPEKLKFDPEKLKFDPEKSKFDQEKSKFDQEKSKFDLEKSNFGQEKSKFDPKNENLSQKSISQQPAELKLTSNLINNNNCSSKNGDQSQPSLNFNHVTDGQCQKNGVHDSSLYERALFHGFMQCDVHLQRKCIREVLRSGTTAACVLIVDQCAFVAWAGDSQVFLIENAQQYSFLTPKHDTKNEAECSKIVERNGVVVNVLGTNRVNGVINVTRSLGDQFLKPPLTAEPEIKTVQLKGSEQFLIIGCDGLWDGLTPDYCVELVTEFCHENKADSYSNLANFLVEKAQANEVGDNITAVVVFLQPFSTLKSLYT